MGCTLSRQIMGLGNMCCSLVASLLSICGTALSVWNLTGFAKAVGGLGGGAAELDDTVFMVTGLAVLVVLLNFLGALVIGSSSFDCGTSGAHREHVHSLTTSRSLFCGHMVSWLLFLVQFLLTQFVLVAVVVTASLRYICNAGKAVQYNSQQLVNEIVNEINGPDYDELGRPIARMPDTSMVSIRDLVMGLDIATFCASSRDTGQHAVVFYIGCLLVSAAQAMMATALWGESQRVAVHENTEHGVTSSMSKYSVGYCDGVPGMHVSGSGRYLHDPCISKSLATSYPYPYAPAEEAVSSVSSSPGGHQQSESYRAGRMQRDMSLLESQRYSLDFRDGANNVQYF